MSKPSGGSVAKPKALFLSPEAPYPVIGGGPLRSASLLEYLARRYAVHAIVFREAGVPNPASSFPAGLVERLDVIELPYHSRSPWARVARNIPRILRNRPPLLDRFSGFTLNLADRYDVAVVEHFWCAPYIEQLRPRADRVIVNLHNIESAWHESLARSEPGLRALALRRFAAAARALEQDLLPQFDAVLAASLHDSAVVKTMAPAVSAVVYPNALPAIPVPHREERHEIVFSGNLEYQPNIGAVRYFHERVWPLLKSRWPELRWKIVGKNPRGVEALVRGDPRIELTGFIDDAIAFLACAQAAVVPVLAGSGTRVKILEAWAAGTAVVSTTIGAEGLDCTPGQHLLIADDPDSFAEAVSALLSAPQHRNRVGAEGRGLFEEKYTWPAAWQVLDSIFGNTPSRSQV